MYKPLYWDGTRTPRQATLEEAMEISNMSIFEPLEHAVEYGEEHGPGILRMLITLAFAGFVCMVVVAVGVWAFNTIF